MEIKNIKQLKDKYSDLFSDLEIEEILKESSTRDEFMEEVENLIRKQEIIYYDRAMRYLSEYDDSLTNSMGLAESFGYKAKDLNSELLATILLQNQLSQDFNDFIGECDFAEDN